MNQEIERKFVVHHLPDDLDLNTGASIQQGYLYVENDREVRIRKKDDRFYLTAKQGSGLQRNESETEITSSQFDIFWPLTQGRRLQKTRLLYPYGKYTIELDIYEGNIKPLIIAEVEFKTVEDAEQFSKPEFLAEEVTDLAAYKNMNLALKGKPDTIPEKKHTVR